MSWKSPVLTTVGSASTTPPRRRLFEAKILAVVAVIFAGGLYAFFRNSQSLAGLVIWYALLGIYILATFIASDRQPHFWRQVVGPALNVGFAVGIALFSVMLLDEHRDFEDVTDALVTTSIVGVAAVFLAGLLAAARLAVRQLCQRVFKREPNDRL